jgi:hypothetical protein
MVTDGLEEAELDFHLLARRFKKKRPLGRGSAPVRTHAAVPGLSFIS